MQKPGQKTPVRSLYAVEYPGYCTPPTLTGAIFYIFDHFLAVDERLGTTCNEF